MHWMRAVALSRSRGGHPAPAVAAAGPVTRSAPPSALRARPSACVAALAPPTGTTHRGAGGGSRPGKVAQRLSPESQSGPAAPADARRALRFLHPTLLLSKSFPQVLAQLRLGRGGALRDRASMRQNGVRSIGPRRTSVPCCSERYSQRQGPPNSADWHRGVSSLSARLATLDPRRGGAAARRRVRGRACKPRQAAAPSDLAVKVRW